MTVFIRTKIRLLVIVPLISFQSCQLFESSSSREKLLQKELKSINWTQVDEFPMVADCEILVTSQQQKQCFFEFLSADIKKRIRNNFKDIKLLDDTIYIKITVLPASKLLFETQVSTNSLSFKREIDSILKIDTLEFPKVKPASKRGMIVKSEFVLPIVFKNTK